jgi:hypothetical protein
MIKKHEDLIVALLIVVMVLIWIIGVSTGSW